MSFFEEAQPLNSGIPATPDDSNNTATAPVSPLPHESIPARYQDGRGGINLEQVRREQLRARQQWLRALASQLTSWWKH